MVDDSVITKENIKNSVIDLTKLDSSQIKNVKELFISDPLIIKSIENQVESKPTSLALMNYAFCLEHGLGITKNAPLAAKYYLDAAINGDIKANLRLEILRDVFLAKKAATQQSRGEVLIKPNSQQILSHDLINTVRNAANKKAHNFSPEVTFDELFKEYGSNQVSFMFLINYYDKLAHNIDQYLKTGVWPSAPEEAVKARVIKSVSDASPPKPLLHNKKRKRTEKTHAQPSPLHLAAVGSDEFHKIIADTLLQLQKTKKLK